MAKTKQDDNQLWAINAQEGGVHHFPLKFHFLSIQTSSPLKTRHSNVNSLFIYIVKGTLLDCFTLKSNETHNETHNPNISSSNKDTVVHISVHTNVKHRIHLR